MKKEIKKAEHKKRITPKIVIVPHYIGTEKASVVFKDIITTEIRRKIKKSA